MALITSDHAAFSAFLVCPIGLGTLAQATDCRSASTEPTAAMAVCAVNCGPECWLPLTRWRCGAVVQYRAVRGGRDYRWHQRVLHDADHRAGALGAGGTAVRAKERAGEQRAEGSRARRLSRSTDRPPLTPSHTQLVSVSGCGLQ